jgi:hypothetical protein
MQHLPAADPNANPVEFMMHPERKPAAEGGKSSRLQLRAGFEDEIVDPPLRVCVNLLPQFGPAHVTFPA